MAIDLFVFGTLRDPELLDIVLGNTPQGAAAELHGFRTCAVKGERFPTLVADDRARATGLLLRGLIDQDLARLDFYEGPFAFTAQSMMVETADGAVEALVYLAQGDRQSDGPWDLARWQTEAAPVRREAAREIMRAFGHLSVDDIAVRMDVIETRAQARVNARATVPFTKLRHGFSQTDTEILDHRQPYSKFFALEEVDVSYRQFSGGMGAPIERAIFVSADAVTVLPYDPVRDRVLLIEQFRAGPFLRGDPNPWSLEAIAGRIDAFETAEEAARREAVEEAGLDLGALHLAHCYYSSPGAKTEHLTSYIAIVDLPDGVAGLGGLEAEAEDIRSMIVSFDALMDAVGTGEVGNAPLLISALWLARHRDGLRG